MRIPIDQFKGKKVDEIHLSSELGDARRVEKILDRAGFTYAVDAQVPDSENVGGVRFTGARIVFYAQAKDSKACKKFLSDYFARDEAHVLEIKPGVYLLERGTWNLLKVGFGVAIGLYILWAIFWMALRGIGC